MKELTWLTPQQVAELCDCNERTVRRAVARGELRGERVSHRRVRIAAASVPEWARTRQQGPGRPKFKIAIESN